ncbi:RHS repeat protein [Mucilaginibacter sp. Bleaf8]|uniref:RHS repeat domain-containing protein n=1 Tax=Mucilaginibacter sp. Bleaf8 TaxID=2834430 RepID=UPI001BCC79DD|nr:RHS repeat domain-containing protein [Mucilaginibacter sp. Bleaf8]MBS7563817.1 RHS repeat protein [Mucilaginibacter sp. Bleaf8]
MFRRSIIIYLTIFFLSALTGSSSAQDKELFSVGLQNIVPPSPNVGALTKFGNIPVGPSTGIPQINVPIYSYNANGLSLSVSLDYHAGGIRVDEVASSVGLGWALNAGGAVSRTIRGLEDDHPAGYLNTPYFNNNTGNQPFDDYSLKPFVKANAHTLDIQADIFSYNVNGQSGKFTYGRDGTILMIEDSKVKVEKIHSQPGGKIIKFIITDVHGLKYTFEDTEVTHNPSSAPNIDYVSSWYLTKIESPVSGDHIDLQYEDVFIQPYVASSSESEVKNLYPNLGQPPIHSFSGSTISFSGKKLKQITFPNGVSLRFGYDSALRTDLPNDRLLKQISVLSSANQIVSGFLLQQDYSLTGRATLLSVTPFAGKNADIKSSPYKFYYNSGLPERLSINQDHWGYPTGRIQESENASRIPREIFSGGIAGRYEFPGSNRDADLGGIAGTMNKIVYPTGGHTLFEMEPNQADDGWLNQQFYIAGNDPSYTEERATNFQFSMTNGNPSYQDFAFTYDEDMAPDPNFRLNIQSNSSGSSCENCLIRLEVFEIVNGNSFAVTSIDINKPNDRYLTYPFSLPGLRKGKSYKLRFHYNFTGSQRDFYGAGWLKYLVHPASPGITYAHLQPYVGGLRARSVKDYDGVSAEPVSIRTYEYLNEAGGSSGVLTTYPLYTQTAYYEGRIVSILHPPGADPMYEQMAPNILLRQSSPIYDFVLNGGSPVTYSRIVEYLKGSNTTNGKIERLFTINRPGSGNAGAGQPGYGAYPATPAQNFSWMYGLLEKETVFNAAGEVVKKTVNTYADYIHPGYDNIAMANNFSSYAIAPVMFNVPPGFPATDSKAPVVSTYPPIWFLSNQYFPYAGRSELVNTKVSSFTPGRGEVVTETRYTYDPANYYLKTEKTTNSSRQEEVKNYNYPADLVATGKDPDGVYDALLAANRYNEVIEKSETVAGKQTRMLRTNYGKFNSNNLLLPKSIELQNAANPIETRVIYGKYDTQGRLLEQQLSMGATQSYQWGYNGQYPVALVKNARSNDIFFESFEEGKGNSVNNDAKTGHYSYTGSYSKNLTGLSGGNYTLSYWSKAGDTWSQIISNVSVTGNAYTINLSGQVDDVRLYPKDAEMTTYTYDPLVGMTSQTNARGETTTYEYDEFQRLRTIRDSKGHIIKQMDYHYQNQ